MFSAARISAIWHDLPALRACTSFSPHPTAGLKTLMIGKVKILHLSGKKVRYFFPASFKSWDFPSLAIKWILEEFPANPCLGDSIQTRTHTVWIQVGINSKQYFLTAEILKSFVQRGGLFLEFFECLADKQEKPFLSVTGNWHQLWGWRLPHP